MPYLNLTLDFYYSMGIYHFGNFCSFGLLSCMYDTRSILLDVLSANYVHMLFRLYRYATLYCNEDLPSLVCNRVLFLKQLC